jgi:MFS family permease
MLRRRPVWTYNVVAFGAGMYATFAFVPRFAQTPRSTGYGLGVNVTESSLLMLPMTVMSFVTGHFAGRLARRFGGRLLVICGCLMGVVSMSMLAFVHAAAREVVVSSTVQGVGFGLAYAATSGLIVGAMPADRTGSRAA